MSQNQEIIESKLCAYIDGELDAEGRAEIEKHLEANPQHRRLLESLRATRDLIRWLPRETAPPELAETLSGQLERSVLLNYEGDSLRINFWPKFLAAAAIILLTAGLAVAVFYALPRAQKPQLAMHTSSGEPSVDEIVPAPPAGDARTDTATLSDVDRKPDIGREIERAKAGAEEMSKDGSLAERKLADELPKAGVVSAKAGNVQSTSQLDQLAEQVAQNPTAFLASAEGANNAIAQNSVPLNYNALVLLVRSPAPRETERQLTGYLHQQQIEYRQPAIGQRLEGALQQQQSGVDSSSDMAKKESPDRSPPGSAQVPAPAPAPAQLNGPPTQPSQNGTPNESQNAMAGQQGLAGGGAGGLSGNVYVCQMSRRQAEQLSATIGNDAVPGNQVQNLNTFAYYNTAGRNAGQNQMAPQDQAASQQPRTQFAAKGGFGEGGEREMLARRGAAQTEPTELSPQVREKLERSTPTTQVAPAPAYAVNSTRDRLRGQAALGAVQTQPATGPASTDAQQETLASTEPSQLTLATTGPAEESVNVVIMVQPNNANAAAAAPAATQPSNASLPQKARAAVPSEQPSTPK